MKTLGNFLWFALAGIWLGLGWAAAGLLWCITVVGIPVGVQCFKFAKLAFWPFGRDVLFGNGAGSLLLNIVWIVVSGFVLALEHVLCGCVLCITVVGIPFGRQCFKLARLALFPFGSTIVRS